MNLLEKTCQNIFPQDSTARAQAKRRLDALTMPHWALGDLMDLAVDLAGMTNSLTPDFSRKAVFTMAGDHGVTEEGVSKFPAEVTAQMVYNFVNGGAGINALAGQAGAEVIVVDMGVNAQLGELFEQGKVLNKKVGYGTNNIAKGPAMSIANARKAVEYGIEVALEYGKDFDLLGTGDMGIGNTTPSTAIAAVVTGKPLRDLTGRGTGLDDQQLENKIATIEKALQINKPDKENGLDILAKVGGYEIGGLAGLIIGGAMQRKPLVIDGLISTAGALIAYKIEPFIRDYLVFAHRSVEPGHRYMQQVLGCQKPLLDLHMRLGEGTGAALAMNIVDASCRVLTQVATFAEAEVAGSDK